MATHLQPEAESVQRIVQMVDVIGEKSDGGNLPFPRSSRLKQPNVAESIRFRINRGERSTTLSVDVNGRFVDRDLIRSHADIGL